MRRIIFISIRTLLFFTLLTGVLYPLAVTICAQSFFPYRANGSLLFRGTKYIGSELLAQSFKKPEYFWPRPSGGDFATVPAGASNLGPTSRKLKDRVLQSMKDLSIDPNSDSKPYDLLFTSASGLDPHITPESARFQVSRVAVARGIDPAILLKLVEEKTEPPYGGLLGRPRVNVLNLNLALDEMRR